MRLRARFALALVLVALVLSMTTLVGFTLYRDATVAQERSELRRTSGSVATQLDVLFGEKREIVVLWADTDSLQGPGAAQRDAALASFVRSTTFSGASVVAANGTMTAIHSTGLNATRERALVGRSFADRTYVRRALSGETYVSDPVDADSGYRIVTVSAPITDGGRVVGAFNAAFHVGQGDLAGLVRASSTGTRGIRVAADGATVFGEGPEPGSAETEIAATATVESTGWTVTTTTTGEGFGSPVWRVTALQAGAFALVLLSLGVFGWWLYREYVGNVERLQTGFDALVDGDYGTRVALSGATEWDRVGDQFNELSETLARRRTEVTVLNRVLRHNLRNAMSVVVGNAGRIEETTDDEAVAADARRIRRRGESLLDLADHARAVESSLGAREEGVAVRRVGAVFAEVGTILTDEFPAASVTVDAVDAADVRVPDGDLLVVVLDELGRNAIVHDDGPQAEVRLTAEAEADTVTITVRDDGPGLPPVEQRVLTEPFVETPTQHGSGLGLWVVTWLVTRVDGDIAVSTGGGTTVSISLPRASDVAAEDDTGVDGAGVAEAVDVTED